MTWTHSQGGVSSGTSATASRTMASAPTAGRLLVAGLSLDDARTITTPTGWTRLTDAQRAGTVIELYRFYRVAQAGDSSTLSIGLGTSTGWNLSVHEWTPTSGTVALDADAVLTGAAGSNPFSPLTGTADPTDSVDALVVMHFGSDGNITHDTEALSVNGAAFSTTGVTERSDGSSGGGGVAHAVADWMGTTASGTYRGQARQSDTRDYANAIAIFKVTAGGSPQEVTPSATAVPLGTVAPVVGVGAVQVSPGALAAPVSSATPTLTVGAVTLQPTAASVPITPAAPSVAVGGVVVTPTPGTLPVVTAPPTTSVGGVTAAPDPAIVASSVATPAVVMGTVTLAPGPVLVGTGTPTPLVAVGTVVLAPGALAVLLSQAQPFVTYGERVLAVPVVITLSNPAATAVVGPVQANPSPVQIVLSLAQPGVTPGAVVLLPGATAASILTTIGRVYETQHVRALPVTIVWSRVVPYIIIDPSTVPNYRVCAVEAELPARVVWGRPSGRTVVAQEDIPARVLRACGCPVHGIRDEEM